MKKKKNQRRKKTKKRREREWLGRSASVLQVVQEIKEAAPLVLDFLRLPEYEWKQDNDDDNQTQMDWTEEKKYFFQMWEKVLIKKFASLSFWGQGITQDGSIKIVASLLRFANELPSAPAPPALPPPPRSSSSSGFSSSSSWDYEIRGRAPKEEHWTFCRRQVVAEAIKTAISSRLKNKNTAIEWPHAQSLVEFAADIWFQESDSNKWIKSYGFQWCTHEFLYIICIHVITSRMVAYDNYLAHSIPHLIRSGCSSSSFLFPWPPGIPELIALYVVH